MGAISALKIEAGWVSLCGLITASFIAAFWFVPGPALLIGVGLLAAALVVVYPPLAVLGVIAADGFAIIFMLLGVDSGLTGYGSYSLLILAVLTVYWRYPDTRSQSLPVVMILGFVLLYGVVVAAEQLGSQQLLSGVRLLSTPVLIAVVGMSMGTKDAGRFLRFGTLVVAASFAAALVERNLGVDILVSYGLEAGTTVRTFDSELRAPGLFATNYSMGAFAGVMGALALLWWPAVEPEKPTKVWRTLAVVGSVGCLYLSIYRAGILVLAVAMALWILFGRGNGVTLRKLLVLTVASSGLYYFFQLGFGSNSSLLERFSVWGNLIASSPPKVLGYGIGYSGAASSSRFAGTSITVDNYYLSLLLQLGIIAIAVVLPLLLIAFWMTVRSSSHSLLRSGMVLAGCLVAFGFVDYWEYISAMSMALGAVGIGYTLYKKSIIQEPLGSSEAML